jgi:hypothetical protein
MQRRRPTMQASSRASQAGRRRRLTLAPRPGQPSLVDASPPGSRFFCLGSDSSGFEAEGDSIPVCVALEALDEEVRPVDGWMPVTRRRSKAAKDTIDDFWREIGYPTPLSRPWEHARCSRSPTGESNIFCRSVYVYAATDGEGSSTMASPPSGAEHRAAFSSPSASGSCVVHTWVHGGDRCRGRESLRYRCLRNSSTWLPRHHPLLGCRRRPRRSRFCRFRWSRCVGC